ncbi:hypothetical protein B0H14DRAFT_3535246 [Mycena olivaceomarginata]|nr:hypothetical protein B0H14DRAFT_3535246 [Mycena olivaceomarginata]
MFQLHSLSSASAPSVWGPSLTDKLLHNAERLEKVHDWVWEMIQFELEPLAAATTLFVQVSWARFQGFEKDALALLIQAQRDAFKANVSVDAAFGEPRLRTYNDDAALVADTFPDLEGLLVQKLSIKVTRSQTWHETFAKELVQDSERMDVVHGWIWYCIAFELEPVAAALLFVKVLCYRFQGCDQEALALLLRVQIETFKAQIGTEIDLKDNSPPEPSQRGDVKAAVTIMKEMREVRKARYRLGTFADAVKCWCHLPSVDLWDRVQLFRDICSTPVADGWLESCSPNWELVKEILVQAQAERSHLRHVNEQAFRRRKSTYSPKVKEGKPGQSAGIKTKTTALGTSCQRRQAKEHVLSYDDKPDSLLEHVLPYDDIVRVANAPSCPDAIPSRKWSAASDVMAGQVKRQVFSPNELQLKEIAPRTKEELGDCRQDIALFQEEGTGHLIGGVQFDAWDRQTLTGLRKNHATAGEYAKAAKRSGRKGDGYGTYAYHSAQNVQGVRALFAAANTHSWRPSALSLRKWYAKYGQKTQAAGINRMGRTGMNSFYCWEYASPLHVDDDEGWSICCQLYKNCRSDEYNFAYVEWGIYIRTEANCIWFFNPNHLHGTVLPRQSSLASAVSRGTHTTIRRKDIEKASLFDEVRATYTTRSNFWRA